MVGAFNDKAAQLNIYSLHELRLQPINAEDVLGKTSAQGRSLRIIDECRLLCYHVMARHVMVYDGLKQDHRLLSHREIGKMMGGRTEVTIKFGKRSICERMARVPALKLLLQDALMALEDNGFTLWAATKALNEDPCS